ncbi:MAG TPA: hypothetical protein VJX67_03120 [Blastocatellia bacterium]|nr:hypothetical protein [Blastocatellia bacterium]
MKYRLVVFSVVLVLASAALAWAGDVSGKWNAQVPGRNGETREATFNFKVDGSTLSGTVSGPRGDLPISEGKVSGDAISFTVALEFGGNEVKLLYKGVVAGDEIKFTRSREGSDRPAQEFTAKRAK